MNNQNQIVIVIVVIIAILFAFQVVPRLPLEIRLILGLASAGFMLFHSVNQLRSSGGGASLTSGKRVQYWRGQRIEIEEPRSKAIKRSFNRRSGIALVYAAVGASAIVVLGARLLNVF